MSINQVPKSTTPISNPRRWLRRVGVVLAGAAVALSLSACQSGTMWRSCTPASDGNPFGQDGTYILMCRNGEWAPIMTVGEYVRLRAGQSVTIAPVPHKPKQRSVAKPTPKIPQVPTFPSGGQPPPPPV